MTLHTSSQISGWANASWITLLLICLSVCAPHSLAQQDPVAAGVLETYWTETYCATYWTPTD